MLIPCIKNQIMMRKLLTLSILLISFNLWSQNYNLPYRVDDLFGVANSEGQIIIKPQFDMIEPLFSRDNKNKDSFFIAYYSTLTPNYCHKIVTLRVLPLYLYKRKRDSLLKKSWWIDSSITIDCGGIRFNSLLQ